MQFDMDSSGQTTMDRTESAPDAKLGEEPAVVEVDEVAVGSKEQKTPATATLSKSAEELAQEQRTWHEQRIRQRLQNEYERAGRALSAVVGGFNIAVYAIYPERVILYISNRWEIIWMLPCG